MDDLPPITPVYSAEQLEEIGRIDYLLDELRKLRDRGMVAPGMVVSVEAEKASRREEIERRGLAAGAMKVARGLSNQRPETILAYADRARALDPSLVEAWAMSATLLGRLREFDRAIAISREAAEIHGHSVLADRIGGLEAEKERQARASAIEAASARAGAAVARDDHEAALIACREVMQLSPRHSAAISIAIRSLIALGRLDEAEESCRLLRTVDPRQAADWSARIGAIRNPAPAVAPPKPEAEPEIRFLGDPETPSTPRVPASSVAVVARPAWSSIAREFLEDHWQKLILSLAVLLIVVSSTVGAAMVLGDRLWMPEGKCLLATAYTVMFAGFGRWLSSWGADRAGRIMRLTTLFVLPVNFAMVGELPGLGRASPTGLAVLAVDSAAMMGLAWIVCRSLGISGGKGTPLALIAIGMIDAMTPRSASFGWVFAMILGSSGVFAASGEWLARCLERRRGGDENATPDAPYFAFGLLAFSYLCAVGRLGESVLEMPPTLYALPAMLAAFAAVRVADGLKATGLADRSVAPLRLAGYGLSALAIALGLARPEVRLPLYSGNTLVAALVGLALFGRGLRIERRPAFLYAGFAALFLAYFGTHEFVKDYVTGVEGRIGHALGYGRKLPLPFKSLNGLAFNGFLAGLSIFFARRWNDDRLAWHCHLIGLPVSIAACVLSGFHPLAAVLTMGVYAVAYGVASGVFAAPWLVYLACAAFAGSAIASTSTLGDLSAGARSLSLAAVGLVLWAASRVLAIERVPTAYRVPVVRSARMVAVVALGLAAVAVWPSGPPSWTTASACWALMVLYILIGIETPLTTIAFAAGSCAAMAILLTIPLVSTRNGWTVDRVRLGAWAAMIGVLYQVASPGLRGVADRRASRLERPSRASIYPTPLFVLGLILAGLATWLAGAHLADRLPDLSAGDLSVIALTMAMVALGLAIASAWSVREESLSHPAVLAGSSAVLAAALALGTSRGWSFPASMALSNGGLGLMLIVLGDRFRDRATGWFSLYRRPFLADAIVAIALSWTACGFTWPDTRTISVSLTLTALTLTLATRQVLGRWVAHLALASGLAAWTLAQGMVRLDGLDDLPRVALFVLIYLVAALAVAEVAGRLRRGAGTGAARRAFGAALPEFATVVAVGAMAMGAVGVTTDDWPRLSGVLTLGSAVFLWLGWVRREAPVVLFGLVLAWLATAAGTRWIVGNREPGIILGWLALVSAVDGAFACRPRWLGHRRGFVPLDPLVILMAIASSVLGVAGPILTLDAYPQAVAALLLTIASLAVSAAMNRSAWRTYGAIVVGVVAAYLTLFEIGRGRNGPVSTLGVLASLLAIVIWGLHRLASRASWAEWRGTFAVPLRDATIALAVLAISFEWDAPGPLLLASVPFLLFIKTQPSAGWLYPSLALVLASGAFAVFHRWGWEGLTPWAVGSAFGCWGLGLVLARWKPVACRRLGLSVDFGYEFPPHHAAMVLGATALAFRLRAVVFLGEPWSASPWVPAGVGVLSLLMLKPYPSRGWVDGFVFLLSTAAILAIGLRLDSPMSWGLAALTLALIWRTSERVAARAEADVCRRVGVGFDRVSAVFHQWSLVLLALGSVPVVNRVVASVLGSTIGELSRVTPLTPLEWWEGLVAILLFGANVELAGRTLGSMTRFLLHATATLSFWWLAVAGSPALSRLGLDPAVILPLITVAQALALALIATRSADVPVALYGSGLSLVAVLLTGGRLSTTTTTTLLLATVTLGMVALSSRKNEIAGLASLLWGLALGCVAEQAARRFGWARSPVDPSALGVGQAVAALGMVVAGGWGRRAGLGLALVVEGFAVVFLAIAAGAVGYSMLGPDAPDGVGRALVGVGVMSAIGSMCVILSSRWSSMPMAFAAQAAVLLGFAAFRSGFVLSPMGDAAAILVLAGIDLGVAEVAGRGRLWFALPTLVTGLALPLISVGLSLRDGPIGESPMFVLFAAGTFYAATCGRLRWKGLGYASAVLYNAALWVLWARFGWKMAEDPQFYVVPVGFSTILFAEANVGSLGRSQVNAIRGAGLALIYLALAVPIWQTASLVAWATVLGVSLAGIFAGIGLRSQAFLWLGLAGFVLDVLFQLGRIGMEHALAKWAIMLVLGILLVLFVALNEKQQLLLKIRKYVDLVRQWE